MSSIETSLSYREEEEDTPGCGGRMPAGTEAVAPELERGQACGSKKPALMERGD